MNPDPGTLEKVCTEPPWPDPDEGPLGTALTHIRRHVATDGELCGQAVLPARPAVAASRPPDLHERLLAWLQERGKWPLWRHQAQAIEVIQGGGHVVVASSTASGKTLCYNLPVLDGVLRGKEHTALYIFPTKALAQDQQRTLGRLIDDLGLRVEAGIYDGDTEPVRRRQLRRRGRIILTNPDMLHTAILPHHGGWAGLFANLRFVVVDELHTLRGIFGSHVANVLRRLRRIARHYGADPIFICASATIANPAEHAERLLGVPVQVVADDGAPRGEKRVVLWNPPLRERDDGTSYRKGAPSVAVRLLPELVRHGVKTICFARARNTVELILRNIRERGQLGAELAARIEPYRGGYLPSERRAIERRLFEGELLGVISTNALELGIDIGGLDAAVIAGWPGSVCSFLQQSGRAGRRSDSSVVFLVAGQEPVDQYFMRHPEALFESNPENAVIEWQNPYIFVRHLVCAAYELPLSEDDSAVFGDDLLPMLTLLEEQGRLGQADGRWHFVDRGYPARDVKLRSASDENFTIFERGPDRVVGELDYVAAMLSLYEGAVYLHRTETFLVEEMDQLNQLVKIRRTETGYYTQALCQKKVDIVAGGGEAKSDDNAAGEWERREQTGCLTRLCEVDVVTHITGFKKVRFHTLENIGYGRIDLPPLELDTVALVIDLTPETVAAANRFGPDFLSSGLHGLARLFQQLLSIHALCDPGDLDTFIDGQRVYIYDLYPGGIGYSEIGFEKYTEVLEATLEAVLGCSCAAGCPSCVLPVSSTAQAGDDWEYPYPKEATRFVQHRLLGLADHVPQLDGVALTRGVTTARLPALLDPRSERKARKAIGRLNAGQ